MPMRLCVPALIKITGTSAPFLSDRVSFLQRPANSRFILCKIIARPMHTFGVSLCAKMDLFLFALMRGRVFLRPNHSLLPAPNWKSIILRVLPDRFASHCSTKRAIPFQNSRSMTVPTFLAMKSRALFAGKTPMLSMSPRTDPFVCNLN